MKIKILICICTILVLCFASKKLFSQSTNDNTANLQMLNTDYLGWNLAGPALPLNILTQQAQPIDFYTNAGNVYPWVNKAMRLHSSGELSINTYLAVDPLPVVPLTAGESQLNIRARTTPLTGLGWHGGIKLSNHAAITFDRDLAANNYYFMAYASNNPQGDLYHGLVPNMDGVAIPHYIYKMYGITRAGQATEGTHQFGEPVYLWPINNGMPGQTSTLPPCSLAIAPTGADVWLDNYGLYQSEPLNVEVPAPVAAANEGLVVADDFGIFNRKLTFSGNITDVLLGDGTWGNVGVSGIGIGLCSTGLTQLPSDGGFDFFESNFVFNDPTFPPATQNNTLAIGYVTCPLAPLPAKVDVFSQTTSNGYSYTHLMAGKFYETGDYSSPPASGLDNFVGVYGECDVRDLTAGGVKRNNLGGDFYASQTTENIGARGTANGTALANNIGLVGIAENAPINNTGVNAVAVPTANATNFGIHATALTGGAPPAGSVNIAVYGDLLGNPLCTNPFTCPGYAGTAPDFAGYFDGDLLVTANAYILSDANLKSNIETFSNGLEIISQLQPKSYTFNQEANMSMILPAGNRVGLLAQDVYEILPQLTKNCVHPARYDSDGNQTYSAIDYKAVNYIELIPYLIAAVKEQQQQIENLQTLADELTQSNLAPPGGNDNSGSSIDVTLSSKTIVLNQNVPNPFKEQTTIEYFIPDAEQVKIIFTDNKGSVLKEVEITEKGKGQLNVYAADLSSGIYSYTIVANGVTIDTKQMVKTK